MCWHTVELFRWVSKRFFFSEVLKVLRRIQTSTDPYRDHLETVKGYEDSMVIESFGF